MSITTQKVLDKNARSRARHGSKWKATARSKYASEPLSQTHSIWRTMISRCHRPEHDTYAYYGGRGIQVCSRWRESFDAFLADMGMRPDGLMIERKDGIGNYEPENCYWANRSDQMKHRERLPACGCGTCGICLHREKSRLRIRAKRAASK